MKNGYELVKPKDNEYESERFEKHNLTEKLMVCECKSCKEATSSIKPDVTVSPAQSCNCTPYNILCCCGPQNGISVIQPACQNLPDGRVITNPAYVAELGKSFWTYKFMTDCNSATRAISNIGIPICNIINSDNIIVSEKIDGCGIYTPVSFELKTSDPNLGTAPSGFQFVKIETNGRYDKGVTVEYRLEITGDFPIAIEPISLKAATTILIFDCDCFLVPQCNPQGKLSLTKECGNIITNNQATLIYRLTVNNIGDGALTDVLFRDTIIIPGSLNIGTITVFPATLDVSTSTPGQIIISGNLGTLEPSGQVIINYEIQITGISSPGSFLISNTAIVSAVGTQSSATCFTTVNAAQVDTNKCCVVINGNTGSYRITITSVGLSPDILVDVIDDLIVHDGLTVQFTNFSGCTATFASSCIPVPLNTNITGPQRIHIACNSLLIPNSGSIHKDITFILVSSTTVGITSIENTIASVTPTNPENQVFLGAGNIPQQVNMNVELRLECTKPCN
jgi:hypothetical protein